MKEKILSALKAAIAVGGKTSLSDKTLNAYVDVISAQITDETQIAEAIKPHVALLQTVQGNINAVASAAATATKTDYEKQLEELKKTIPANPTDPKDPKTPDSKDDEISKFLKSLDEKIGALNNEIGSLRTEKTQTALSGLLLENLKSKNVPEFFYSQAVKGRQFKDEQEATSFAEELGGAWDAAKQTLANQGFKDTVPPTKSGGVDSDATEAAKLIEAGTKEIILQNQQNQK